MWSEEEIAQKITRRKMLEARKHARVRPRKTERGRGKTMIEEESEAVKIMQELTTYAASVIQDNHRYT